MGVKVLTHTTDIPITMIGEMAGICWNAPNNHKKNFKRAIDCIRNDHGRTLEFPQIYLEIEGYSARVIRELYTHIGGAPTRLQESTRYVDMTEFKFVTPPKVEKIPGALHTYELTMEMIKTGVQSLEELGVPREDSAMLLPLGMETKIVLRTNLRNLVDMCKQRLCTRAYWEFRNLMNDMLNALAFYSDEWKILLEIEDAFKPKCEWLGYCPEKNPCKHNMKSAKPNNKVDYDVYLDGGGIDLSLIKTEGKATQGEIKKIELVEG